MRRRGREGKRRKNERCSVYDPVSNGLTAPLRLWYRIVWRWTETPYRFAASAPIDSAPQPPPAPLHLTGSTRRGEGTESIQYHGALKKKKKNHTASPYRYHVHAVQGLA